MTKALDLFQAYHSNSLPKEGGYIVSSFFSENSKYSRYEIVSYNGVKSILLGEEGLTFQSDGKKIFVLVEPATYPHKQLDPVHRSQDESVPHRYKEMSSYTCANQTKVMVSLQPVETYSSFTILKPTVINFALVFFESPEVFDTLDFFFQKTLNREAGVPQHNAVEAAHSIKAQLPKLYFSNRS